MSGFIAFRISAVACLLVFLHSRQSLAIWRWHPFYRPTAANLPDDPNDPYYRRFQTVPTPEVTATQLMTKFLGINPTNTRGKRSVPLFDVVIVMDGSGSVGSCKFERGKAAMMNLLLAASEDTGVDEKFAAVTFSSSASVNFNFLSPSAAQQQVMRISYPGGGTNTQAGLEMAKTALFQSSSAGGRVSSRKRVLLVTDGQSNIQKKQTIPKANDLKNMGIEIYVVAVGSYIAGIGEMVKVAGSNDPFMRPGDYLFRVHNYQGLWQVTKLVVQKMASTGKYVSLSPHPSPC